LRNGSHGLGIELAVVDGDVGVDGTGYFDTDEAALGSVSKSF